MNSKIPKKVFRQERINLVLMMIIESIGEIENKMDEMRTKSRCSGSFLLLQESTQDLSRIKHRISALMKRPAYLNN